MKEVIIQQVQDGLKIKNPIEKVKIEEVCYFSDTNGDVKLNKDNLHAYQIPAYSKTLTCPYGWNTKLGYNGYKPKVYATEESTIANFLKCLLQLHRKNSHDLEKYQVFAPSSFFQYIAVNNRSEFNVVYLQNKLFISNCETRAGQDKLMSYVGIRFEDLLQHGVRYKTCNNLQLFESVKSVQVGGTTCLYYAEIDSVSASGEYTEIKMILCKKQIPTANLKDKRKILEIISRGNNYFELFLLKLIIQSTFGGNSNVVIGVRDSAFNIRNITEYSLSDDLIPFLKNKFPERYMRYLTAIDNIENVLLRIKKSVSDSKYVFKLKIDSEYKLLCVDDANEKAKILRTVLIPDFMEVLQDF